MQDLSKEMNRDFVATYKLTLIAAKDAENKENQGKLAEQK